MERKIGYFVPIGLLIGVVFGWGLGATSGNAIIGTGVGALVGVFSGWFIAAAVFEKEEKDKEVRAKGKSIK
jgi:ABC-type microcin C transport system permease subunit YejE